MLTRWNFEAPMGVLLATQRLDSAPKPKLPAKWRVAVVAVPPVRAGARVWRQAAAAVVTTVHSFSWGDDSLNPSFIIHLPRHGQSREHWHGEGWVIFITTSLVAGQNADECTEAYIHGTLPEFFAMKPGRSSCEKRTYGEICLGLFLFPRPPQAPTGQMSGEGCRPSYISTTPTLV